MHSTSSLRPDSEEIEQFVHRAVEREEIAQFSIGCSSDLVDAHDDQACDFIISLCVTDNPEHATSFEGELLQAFSAHPKFRNWQVARHRGSRPAPRYVCLALWKLRSHH